MSRPFARLSRTYDPAALQRDLAAVEHYRKVSQPGPYHDGQWKGLNLYAQGGTLDFAGARRSLAEPFVPTPALAETPYIRRLLDELDGEKYSVRLLALPPGAVIGEHSDDPLTLASGVARLHVPIVTHPEVEFVLDGERCRWREGELWWGDFSRPHSVTNRSPVTRVHLVIDLEITEALLDLFPDDVQEEVRRAGVSVRRQPVELGAEEAERYRCRFRFPPGALPDFPDGFVGVVEATAGELVIEIGGTPAFHLVPYGEHRFGITGFGSGTLLAFGFDEGELTGLELLLDAGAMAVPLELEG